MASFVIGDVHGCYRTLLSLLATLDYRPEADHIWMVGDLVNRGPDSAAVTRWAASQVNVDTVLGNHDLFLLACACGVAKPRKSDDLDAFLSAPDCSQLVDWLRRRPLLVEHEDHIIVHAGLLPQWTVETARNLAREVEGQLGGPGMADFLKGIFDKRQREHDSPGGGRQRVGTAARVFTSLRTCRPATGFPVFVSRVRRKQRRVPASPGTSFSDPAKRRFFSGTGPLSVIAVFRAAKGWTPVVAGGRS